MTREQCWSDAVESANILMRVRGRAEWSTAEYDHAKMIFRRRWGKVGHEVDVERPRNGPRASGSNDNSVPT